MARPDCDLLILNDCSVWVETASVDGSASAVETNGSSANAVPELSINHECSGPGRFSKSSSVDKNVAAQASQNHE